MGGTEESINGILGKRESWLNEETGKKMGELGQEKGCRGQRVIVED